MPAYRAGASALHTLHPRDLMARRPRRDAKGYGWFRSFPYLPPRRAGCARETPRRPLPTGEQDAASQASSDPIFFSNPNPRNPARRTRTKGRCSDSIVYGIHPLATGSGPAVDALLDHDRDREVSREVESPHHNGDSPGTVRSQIRA